jgi:hypothetical protein
VSRELPRERIAKAIYDASILMLLYDGVDVFSDVSELLGSEPECIVPKSVLAELERIAAGEGWKKTRAAKLALEVVARRSCKVIDTGDTRGDEAIITLALTLRDAIPVTADNELRRRLREKGIPNIYYRRSRHKLMLEY